MLFPDCIKGADRQYALQAFILMANKMMIANVKRSTRQRMRGMYVLLKLVVAAGIGLSTASSSASPWGLNLYSHNDEVRVTFTEKGLGKYTLIFGYGGCVADILDHDQDYGSKLAGPYNGEETDRVLQTVLWGLSKNANIGRSYRTRWNVNQAGTFEDEYAQIVSFNMVTNKVLEIYSVNGKQWYRDLEDDYQGSERVSQYTRYSCEEDGVLSVRTITRIPRISVLGRKQKCFKAYIEHWSAFKNTPSVAGFNAVAMRADDDGTPSWWYSSQMERGRHVLPNYPNWILDHRMMSGYAFVFNSLSAAAHPVAAMVFGNDNARRAQGNAHYKTVLNFKHWLAPNVNPGIGILPGIYIDDALPGTLIDFEYKLIIRPGSNAEFMKQVTSAVGKVIIPRIYEPDEATPLELTKIKTNLNRIIDQDLTGTASKNYWERNGKLFKRYELFD